MFEALSDALKKRREGQLFFDELAKRTGVDIRHYRLNDDQRALFTERVRGVLSSILSNPKLKTLFGESSAAELIVPSDDLKGDMMQFFPSEGRIFFNPESLYGVGKIMAARISALRGDQSEVAAQSGEGNSSSSSSENLSDMQKQEAFLYLTLSHEMGHVALTTLIGHNAVRRLIEDDPVEVEFIADVFSGYAFSKIFNKESESQLFEYAKETQFLSGTRRFLHTGKHSWWVQSQWRKKVRARNVDGYGSTVERKKYFVIGERISDEHMTNLLKSKITRHDVLNLYAE